MTDVICPEDEDALAAAVAAAGSEGRPLEICGGGSKRAVGRPTQTAARLSAERMTGVTLYEPGELVISARAGTPVRELEDTLAENDQWLAFEPVDLGPLLGQEAGQGSIGAVFATNLSGSRRIQAGAARDHLLGLRGVSGRGEVFKSGGRVMRNVAGYDLCRGLSGSWGTLAVLTEVTVKVLPRAEATRTLLLRGLTDEVATEAMCAALGSPLEVSGAIHLPVSCALAMQVDGLVRKNQAVTAFRLETFASFLDDRFDRLAGTLAAYGKAHALEESASAAFWGGVRTLSFFAGGEGDVWRISVAPDRAERLVTEVSRHLDCRAVYDWSGGLIWLEVAPSRDAGAMEVRRAIVEMGGHATLIRAAPAVRAAVEVFQPPSPAVMDLTRRIKSAFDPAGILNPGRMYAGV